jgi:hypothetical protein
VLLPAATHLGELGLRERQELGPLLRFLGNGVPDVLDELKALGDAQPAVVEGGLARTEDLASAAMDSKSWPVVVLDSLSPHKAPRVRALIEAAFTEVIDGQVELLVRPWVGGNRR